MKNAIDLGDSKTQETNSRRHFSVRLNLFFFCVFLLLTVLIMRLALLQFVEGKQYKDMENNTSKADITIAPIRGNIFDSTGYPIASTISSQSLFFRIEPGQHEDDWIALAKNLEQVFAKYGSKTVAPMTAADIIKAMDVGINIDGSKGKDMSYKFMPRRIKPRLTKPEIAYLEEHRDEFKGVEITEESTRVYDSQRIAVQLIGYMRSFSAAANQKASWFDQYKHSTDQYLNDEYVGYDGIENMYQEELRGKNGQKSYPVNSKSQIVGQVQITPPEKGHNLFLTLNKDVQLAAQKAIADHIKFLNNSTEDGTLYYLGKKAVAGYAVAMEVDTGRVVAMANYPDYDPNIWTGGVSQTELSNIQNQFPNGTIRERYPDIADPKERAKHPTSLVPLGSTMKPLTILLGLNEGLITPTTTYNDTGRFYFGKDNSAKIDNSDRHPYGLLTPETAILHSSNTFMASQVGNPLYLRSKQKDSMDSIQTWDKYMKMFGLGISTGSGLPGEQDGDPYYFRTAKEDSPQSTLVFASFGQQARYTVLQLAQYTAMLANQGKRYKPQFVEKITSYDGSQVLQTFQPQILNEVNFKQEYWDVIHRGMRDVYAMGFQPEDNVPYTVARKTGTSEEDVAGARLENAVFIAYAPIEKPKLAIAVVVPEGGFGSWGAAPIARKIFDAYDQYVGLDGHPKGAPPAQ